MCGGDVRRLHGSKLHFQSSSRLEVIQINILFLKMDVNAIVDAWLDSEDQEKKDWVRRLKGALDDTIYYEMRRILDDKIASDESHLEGYHYRRMKEYLIEELKD